MLHRRGRSRGVTSGMMAGDLRALCPVQADLSSIAKNLGLKFVSRQLWQQAVRLLHPTATPTRNVVLLLALQMRQCQCRPFPTGSWRKTIAHVTVCGVVAPEREKGKNTESQQGARICVWPGHTEAARELKSTPCHLWGAWDPPPSPTSTLVTRGTVEDRTSGPGPNPPCGASSGWWDGTSASSTQVDVSF